MDAKQLVRFPIWLICRKLKRVCYGILAFDYVYWFARLVPNQIEQKPQMAKCHFANTKRKINETRVHRNRRICSYMANPMLMALKPAQTDVKNGSMLLQLVVGFCFFLLPNFYFRQRGIYTSFVCSLNGLIDFLHNALEATLIARRRPEQVAFDVCGNM